MSKDKIFLFRVHKDTSYTVGNIAVVASDLEEAKQRVAEFRYADQNLSDSEYNLEDYKKALVFTNTTQEDQFNPEYELADIWVLTFAADLATPQKHGVQCYTYLCA